uniref:Hemicentin-1 n=1 Tax=Heterorhabditis bacteriophora TaxID=37862 RepID=A0A1I7X4Q6_HETBA
MNPMESLRTILLCPIYAGNRQLETAKDLQFSISKEWSEVDESVIKNLVNSMPERIFQVINRSGSCIAPKILGPSFRSQDVILNQTVELICESTGTPAPVIEWLLDGKPLLQGNNIELAENSQILILNGVLSDQEGRYTCKAENKAGKAEADTYLQVTGSLPLNLKYTCIASNRAGEQRASTQLHVLVIPIIEDSERVIQVKENTTLSIECAANGIPPPQISWKRDGIPFEGVTSARLIIHNANVSDAGRFTCTARNEAGHVSADFAVDVFSRPKFRDIKNEVKLVEEVHKTSHSSCPIRCTERVFWRECLALPWMLLAVRGLPTNVCLRFKNFPQKVLLATPRKYSVGYAAFAPPKFHRMGESVYEVIEHDTITLDCAVATDPKPEINWYRGEQPLYLSENMAISSDGMLTIRSTSLSDGGKYMCKASNEAGSSDIDLILKVLVPPKIDKSNIIGNPLAIVERNIYLECPVSGIPQPTVSWTKDGRLVDVSDSRIVFAQNNQTFGIEGVRTSDQARYTCIASNKGGNVEQDFNLEVLTPPELETYEAQQHIKREGDQLSLTCPIRSTIDATSAVSDVSWIKNGRPVDPENSVGFKISADGRRLQIPSTSLSDGGIYTCVALNRAGESSLDFKVEILCTNLASEKCRDLEYQHLSKYRSDYNWKHLERTKFHTTPKLMTTLTTAYPIDLTETTKSINRLAMSSYHDYLRRYELERAQYEREHNQKVIEYQRKELDYIAKLKRMRDAELRRREAWIRELNLRDQPFPTNAINYSKPKSNLVSPKLFDEHHQSLRIHTNVKRQRRHRTRNRRRQFRFSQQDSGLSLSVLF